MNSRDVSSDFGIGMYPMRKAFAASRYDSYSMALYGALRSTGEAEEEGFKVVEIGRIGVTRIVSGNLSVVVWFWYSRAREGRKFNQAAFNQYNNKSTESSFPLQQLLVVSRIKIQNV